MGRFLNLVVLITIIGKVNTDYGCLCIHGGNKVVYLQPFLMSQVLGQLNDGDCKPTYTAGTSNNWTAIQFHKQVGFITNGANVGFFTCQGDPLVADAFPTSQIASTVTDITSAGTLKSTMLTRTTTKLSTSYFTTTDTTRRTLQCPPQVQRSRYLKEFGLHCYEFILGVHKEWPAAERDCNLRDGHLVSVGSQSEQDFIYHSLGELHFHADDGVWIGLTDQNHEGHWTWSSGERVAFSDWAPGQPGIFGSVEDCAMLDMRSGGKWGDFSCTDILFVDKRHGYVCEYKKI